MTFNASKSLEPKTNRKVALTKTPKYLWSTDVLESVKATLLVYVYSWRSLAWPDKAQYRLTTQWRLLRLVATMCIYVPLVTTCNRVQLMHDLIQSIKWNDCAVDYTMYITVKLCVCCTLWVFEGIMQP